MNRWQDGCVNGYSEDLPKKIVSAVGRGMSKAQAARTFEVGLSSLKRYVEKANRGESLAPKKSPGSPPKMEEDLKERPYVTLQERRDYLEAITRLSVSRSSMCRAIARIGSTRKKGTSCHRARRVQEGSLEGDGSCRCGSRVTNHRR